MKPSAVLLIDLENFYCSREDYCNGPQGYDRIRFGYDLDKLLTFARSMAENLPFTVKRAYADFNAARYPNGAAPQYYLRQLPDELLQQGVEPVQVFRLSRGGGGRGSKNAADMRMAMDATALVVSAGHVEHFVLVTGDADFIPVILELKRHGHTVSVIGVTGATSPKIQRFVDNFELFEDLLAAEEVEAQSGDLTHAAEGLTQIAEAVKRLLARSRPLRFAAIKPLLSKELGHPFDPAVFGCDTTGEFLRNHYVQLGIVIRQGQHDAEIDLPGSVPGPNGPPISRQTPRSVPRPAEKPAAKPPQPEPHTAAHYRQLLTTGRGMGSDREGKVHPVPWSVLVWACDTIVPLLTPPTGEPTHTTKLQPKLVNAAEAAGVPDLVKHVRLFYPTLRAGLPVQSADGVYALPDGATGEQIRRSVLSYVGYVLNCRLTEGGIAGEIRSEVLAAVFDPEADLAQATNEIVAALVQPAPVPAPKPAPAPKPTAEEWHTPGGYVKLLKAGGPKGSETESFKVLPVPWASVERVCADAFALLSPTAGGTPLPREQLNARLVEAGKELFVERYDQHVRRVLGILRVAGDLTEDHNVVGLNSDVTSALELRNRALAFLLQLLQLRLEEREIYDPIRPQAFVTALEGGPYTERLLEEVVPAIEWLYQPAAEPAPAPEAAAPLLDPAPESEESAARVPAPDSGVFGVELIATEPELELEPTDPAPGGPVEESGPEMSNTDPTWDPYTFDGALPEVPAPTASVRTDSSEAEIASPFTSEALTGSGVVDVSAITREAVAAAAAEAAELPPGSLDEPPPPAGPEALAPRNAPVGPTADEEIVTAVPVAEWLPDGDPLFLGSDPASTPLPEEVRAVGARIIPPPVPKTVPPPPFPPLPPPPESA